MDDQLKQDIQDHYFDEYFAKVKSEKTGFFGWLDKANDYVAGKIETVTRGQVSTPGLLLLGSFATAAFAPYVGVPMLVALAGDAVLSIYSGFKDSNLASKKIDADIENGTLPALYGAVIDTRIRELNESIEAYKAQKTLLPAKGAAVEAFDNAVTPEKAVEAPKPALTPAATPGIH